MFSRVLISFDQFPSPSSLERLPPLAFKWILSGEAGDLQHCISLWRLRPTNFSLRKTIGPLRRRKRRCRRLGGQDPISGMPQKRRCPFCLFCVRESGSDFWEPLSAMSVVTAHKAAHTENHSAQSRLRFSLNRNLPSYSILT